MEAAPPGLRGRRSAPLGGDLGDAGPRAAHRAWCSGGAASISLECRALRGAAVQTVSRLHVGPHREKGRHSDWEPGLSGPEPPGFLQSQRESTQKERRFSPPERQSGEPCPAPGTAPRHESSFSR